jgi:hypothetical protein
MDDSPTGPFHFTWCIPYDDEMRLDGAAMRGVIAELMWSNIPELETSYG